MPYTVTTRLPQLRPLQPRFGVHGVFLLITLLVTIPVVTWFVADRWILEFYYQNFVAPRVERSYGFTTEPLPVSARHFAYAPFRIASVTPGGPFAQAGVRVGDIPMCNVVHGEHISTFFAPLWLAQGLQVAVRLYRPPLRDPLQFVVMVPRTPGHA